LSLVVVESSAAREDELQWESAYQACTCVIFVNSPFKQVSHLVFVVKP